MISWTQKSENEWVIKKGEKLYPINSLEKLFVFSMAFGINEDEIEEAVLEMFKSQHNYCEFGADRYFIFSEKR